MRNRDTFYLSHIPLLDYDLEYNNTNSTLSAGPQFHL